MTTQQNDKKISSPHEYYRLPEEACPYLPGQQEQKIVTVLRDTHEAEDMNTLTLVGFRRMQNYAFIPRCPNCNACTPYRVPVDTFRPSRQQKRVLRSHRHLSCKSVGRRVTQEQFILFETYQAERHRDSTMRKITFEVFQNIVEGAPLIPSEVIEIRDDTGRLVCVSLIDVVKSGVSAIYTFYDPTSPRRSYGIYSILKLIELTRMRGLPHLYLGFWIPESQKMSYKSAFQPGEIFQVGFWQPVESNIAFS